MSKIKTYQKMNNKIVSLLRLSDDPMLLYAAQLIEELQGKEDTVKQGEWKEHIFEDGFWANYCSECKAYLPYGLEWEPNFCPNCGAKMDGEDEQNV